ncbi:MAG: hypothetical protein FJ096_06110 [Deltaproteobacteria bacterium]|nr:hypothetical protein [Deltaproteobacteria bacterium]
MRSRRRVVRTSFVLAVSSVTLGAAAAEDRRPGLDAEGPPPTPGLSHRGLALDVEYTIASARPTDVVSLEPIRAGRAYGYSGRIAAEWAVIDRRWYVGVASELGAAHVPPGTSVGSGAQAAVFGNPELWTRGLWTSRVGLAAGGGLGVVLPLPRSFDADEAEAVRTVRVVRPWADALFQDRALTARPFLDIRHVIGPVVLQLRQGLDVAMRIRPLAARENRVELSALASVYAGVRVARPVVLGLELDEVYQLTGDVATPSCPEPCDRLRVQFTLAPSVRLAWRNVAPTVSMLFPLSTPLRAEVASYQAVRFHLGARVALP